MRNYLFIRFEDTINDALSLASWIITDSRGRILSLSEMPIAFDNCIKKYNNNTELAIILPERWFCYHVLDIPIKDKKKRNVALPYMLEDKLVSNVDDLHFTVGHNLKNNKYIVSVVDKQKIQQVLDLLMQEYKIIPRYLLSDAICLCNPTTLADGTYSIYLNNDNNLALIKSDSIVSTDLNNLGLVVNQLDLSPTVDLYEYKIDNINLYLNSDSNNAVKLNILSEQKIDNWLVFLVNSWFSNNKRENFNTAKYLVKQPSFNIEVNPIWHKVAVVWLLIITGLYGYKYYDSKIYSQYEQELNKRIQAELVGLDINNTDMAMVDELISKQIEASQANVNMSLSKDTFYKVLSAFAKNYTKEMEVNKLIFKDNKLEITFYMDQGNLDFLEKVKNRLDDITLEQSTVKLNNKDYIVWQLEEKND